MSDFDDSPFDESELAELTGDDPDTLTPEDIFSMVMLNKVKKTKVKVQLQDKEGDNIELPAIVEQLIKYIDDKLKDPSGNQFADQIMPLMSSAVLSTLGRIIGIRGTAFYLAEDNTRMALIWSMCVAFLLLKYVQKHELTINTIEEQVSDEEIEDFERKAKLNNIATLSELMGADPQQVLQELVDQGKITEDDLANLFKKDKKNGD